MHALPHGHAPDVQQPPLADSSESAHQTTDETTDSSETEESGEQAASGNSLTAILRSRVAALATVSKASGRALRKRDWRYPVMLTLSVLALAVGILDFALIVGALPVPVAGLRALGQGTQRDTAVYSFEYDNEGWHARGAASTAIANDTHVFAGHGALEFQATNLTDVNQAFVSVSNPPKAKPGTVVAAHIFVPQGAPVLVAAIYTLDTNWAWQNGQFVTLNPGVWTAVTYSIPHDARGPIHELGIIFVGAKGAQPYAGPIFVDSVDAQTR